MTGSFAAIYDPSSRDARRDEERVAAAVPDLDGSTRHGSLSLAWVGDDVMVADERVVVLDGAVHEPARITATTLADEIQRRGDRLWRDLRGEFVVLAYDRGRDELQVVRDHMGGRGLFWHATGPRVAVASELRHLLPLLDAVPDPDLVSIAHQLAPSATPVDRSLYAGVRRLPGGHQLRATRQGQAVRRYWEIVYEPPARGSRGEHVSGLREVLRTAVARRCDGTNTAIMLSGGLDSSTVAGLSSELAADLRPRRAYSATFPRHPLVDESVLIDKLCDDLGLESTRVNVHRGSVAAGAHEYIEHWLTPPISPNLFFWMPLLRRAAADGTTVLLDGEGGDELFGLSGYLIADRIRRGRLRSAVQLVRDIPGGGDHLTWKHIWPFLRSYGLKGATPAWAHRAVRSARGGETYLPPWVRAPAVEAFMDSDQSAAWKRASGPRWWSHLVDRVTRGVGSAQMHDHVRRRGALYGIHARHPLLDADVIEYVLTLPPELQYDPRHSRPLVREAMAGILPDEVRLRPAKSTFDSVFHEAIAGPDLPVARSLLAPGEALIEQYVDLDLVARLLLDDPPPPDARLDWSQSLWRLITTELWLRVRAGVPIAVDLAPTDVELVTR